MSALQEQHARWKAARSRLMGGVVRQKPMPLNFDGFMSATIPVRANYAWEDTPEKWHGEAWKMILRDVALKHQCTIRDMTGPSRATRFIAARQEAFHRLAMETSMSFTQIGQKMNRDHSTVIHGIKKHQERCSTTKTDFSPFPRVFPVKSAVSPTLLATQIRVGSMITEPITTGV